MISALGTVTSNGKLAAQILTYLKSRIQGLKSVACLPCSNHNEFN